VFLPEVLVLVLKKLLEVLLVDGLVAWEALVQQVFAQVVLPQVEVQLLQLVVHVNEHGLVLLQLERQHLLLLNTVSELLELLGDLLEEGTDEAVLKHLLLEEVLAEPVEGEATLQLLRVDRFLQVQPELLNFFDARFKLLVGPIDSLEHAFVFLRAVDEVL